MTREVSPPLNMVAELCEASKDTKDSIVYLTHILAKNREQMNSDYMSSKISIGRHQDIRGTKEMVVDFICRDDIHITALKEFFEIFIASVSKNNAFHDLIFTPKYKYIGLSLQFQVNSIATLRILLAEEVE